MPLYINQETGQAENIAPEQVNPAIHHIPLVSPEGVMGSAPIEQASELLQQGYMQPSDEQRTSLLEEQHFTSTPEQIKAGIEGLGRGVLSGPVTSTILQATGESPEDISRREKYNPALGAITEMGGLAGSLYTGRGFGAGVAKAAEAVVGSAQTATAIGRVGTVAAKAALENALIQGGHEAERYVLNDPNSVDTAISNIGLAGLLGAGIGGSLQGTAELWKATAAPKLSSVLDSVKARGVGVTQEVKEAANVEVPAVLDAALAGDENARATLQHLQESNSYAGKKIREATGQVRNDATTQLESVVGKPTELSQAEMGKQLQSNLVQHFEAQYEPIAKQYDVVNKKFELADLTAAQKAEVENKIAELGTQEGWLKAPGSAENKLMNRVLKEMPLQENAKDLKQYITNLRKGNPYGSEGYNAAKKIGSVLEDMQEAAIGAKLASTEPMAVENYNALKASYRSLKEDMDMLNERLHAGKHYGAESFIENLKSMDPEKFVSRLSPAGDVNTMALLQSKYPQVVETIKQAEMAKLTKGMDTLEPAKFFKKVDALSPEMRNFMFSPEQQKSMAAIQSLLENLPKTTNPSGTARTLDKITSEGALTSIGLMSAMLSDIKTGGLVALATKLIGKEAPDAVRLAYLKFLASDMPTSAAGFKAVASFAKNAMEGEKRMDNVIRGVFGAARESAGEMVSNKDTRKLDEIVKKVAENPTQVMDMGSDLGHYMPDHATGLAFRASSIVSYLNSIRPQEKQLSPLDLPQPPNAAQKANYENALRIAENPLSIMDKIKNGSVSIQDLTHLNAMYPGLRQRIVMKLNEQLIEAVHDGKTIPYKTKMGLSIFMGQPLESSMAPTSIIANQVSMQPANNGMMPPPQAPAKNTDKLDKLPQQNMSGSQAREASRTRVH